MKRANSASKQKSQEDVKVKTNRTHKIELGISEIGKFPKGGNYLISFENGIKRGDMDYTVTSNIWNCTDLTAQGNYQTDKIMCRVLRVIM